MDCSPPGSCAPEISRARILAAAAAAASLQSCPTLCGPIDISPPGFPSLGFSRQEHWSGLPFSSPMHESQKWKGSRSLVSNSSDPMDCSLPGFSVHGIFQAIVLEWVAISFSRESSWPRDWTQISCIVSKMLDHLRHQGSPMEHGRPN